jgi:hypothetical protein
VQRWFNKYGYVLKWDTEPVVWPERNILRWKS